MEDRKIIERFFARNEDAIKHTDDTYGRRLYLLEDNIVHNGQDAEESVSNVRCEKRWSGEPFLRQHRTMGTAGFGGSFVPIVQYEKWEIHPVFPHFSCLCQNLSPNLLAPLCGAALGKLRTRYFNEAICCPTGREGSVCGKNSMGNTTWSWCVMLPLPVKIRRRRRT